MQRDPPVMWNDTSFDSYKLQIKKCERIIGLKYDVEVYKSHNIKFTVSLNIRVTTCTFLEAPRSQRDSTFITNC